MRKLSFLLTVAVALCMAAGLHAADDAMQLLDKASARLTSAKSIHATYTVTSPGHGSVKGSITVAGQRFTASSEVMTTWFDGKTQWTYAPSTGEVNIIEPLPEEMAQTNPFVIINSLRHNYKAAVMKSTPGTRTIRMTATDRNADIRQAIVTLKASTLLPTALTVTMADGTTLRIAIDSLELGGAVSQTMFTFDKKKYPRARVNDMR